MGTALKQANFQLPEDLLNELRENVEKGELSRFVSNALHRELQRLRQQKVIDTTFGAWKGVKHAELAGGIDQFVRSIRKSTRGKRINASDSR